MVHPAKATAWSKRQALSKSHNLESFAQDVWQAQTVFDKLEAMYRLLDAMKHKSKVATYKRQAQSKNAKQLDTMAANFALYDLDPVYIK